MIGTDGDTALHVFVIGKKTELQFFDLPQDGTVTPGSVVKNEPEPSFRLPLLLMQQFSDFTSY